MIEDKKDNTNPLAEDENSSGSLYRSITSETSRKAADALFKSSAEELSNNFERDGQQTKADQHSK